MSNKKLTEREINIMQKLKHPNIIEFYGFYEDNSDGMFMFLELCDKDNLQKKITEKLNQEKTFKFFK